jgi:hypothetical protein
LKMKQKYEGKLTTLIGRAKQNVEEEWVQTWNQWKYDSSHYSTLFCFWLLL